MGFGEEGGTDGGGIKLLELVVDVAQEDASLADAGVPENDGFDGVGHWIITE